MSYHLNMIGEMSLILKVHSTVAIKIGLNLCLTGTLIEYSFPQTRLSHLISIFEMDYTGNLYQHHREELSLNMGYCLTCCFDL